MKRKVTLLIALAFCTSCAVAGCGSVSNETSEPKEVSVSVTETNAEENETQNSEEVTAEETTAEEEEPAFSFTAKDEIKNADITSGYVQIFNDIFRNGGYITVADFSSQYGDSWDCSNLSRIDQGSWDTISVVHKETGLKMTLFTYQIPEGEVILKFIPQGDTWNYSWMPGGLSSLGFREELEGFSENNIKEFHKMMLTGIKHKNKEISLGEYKKEDNRIVNNAKTTIYIPPHSYEVEEYMNDLIDFMNKEDYTYHPLVNAALMHAQFESIHPFDDGNGRVGRILIPLYLFKTGVISSPVFYISEAIEKDKTQYYRNLTNSRISDMNLWINYFLQKCVGQAKKHIQYFQNLEEMYKSVTKIVKENIASQKSIDLINSLFKYPQLTATKLAEELNISKTQAIRYLRSLEELGVLYTDDRQRNTSFYFGEYLRLLTS